MPTPATADWDAPSTVERVKLWENPAKGSQRKCEFDQMREVPFVPFLRSPPAAVFGQFAAVGFFERLYYL